MATISPDSVAQDQLRAFVERIERMEEEKKAISDDIKEIYAEAKSNGFNTKVLRQIIRIRKQDHAERMEQEALLDLYMAALGMVPALRGDDDDDARQSAMFSPGDGGTSPPAAAALVQRPGATKAMRKAAREFQRSVDRTGAEVTLSAPGQPDITFKPRPGTTPGG